MNDFREVVELSTSCIELNPYEPTGYALRAQANLELRNADEVDADVTSALNLNPDFDVALLLKAYRFLDNGETDDAKRIHTHLESLGSPYAQPLNTSLMYIAMQEASANWDPAAEEWQTLQLPVEDGFVVEFERRRAHPVQAEYERRVNVVSADGTPTVVGLPMNTGGRTHFNVFWIAAAQDDGPWLRLLDHTGEYLLPLTQPSLQRICREGSELSHVASDNCSRFGSDGKLTYAGEAGPPPKLYPGIYLGALDGRTGPLVFNSAKDAPQEDIRRTFGDF